MGDELFFTPKEIAERFKVEEATVTAWLRDGKLKGFQLSGKYWRVKESDLERFIEEGEPESKERKEAGK